MIYLLTSSIVVVDQELTRSVACCQLPALVEALQGSMINADSACPHREGQIAVAGHAFTSTTAKAPVAARRTMTVGLLDALTAVDRVAHSYS